MRSLMGDWYRWLYSSGWRTNSQSFFPSGSCRMNIPDATFPPHGTISTAEKRFVQQRLYFVWHCDFTLHRPSSRSAWPLVLYFVVKIQKIQHVFGQSILNTITTLTTF